MSTSRSHRAHAWLPALGLAGTAAAVRLPALFATRHLSFDDGVYGSSARVMRDGAVPFRAVFSSQGPLFLPLVWLFDLVGGRRLDSPRLLSVAAGVVAALATMSVARRMGASGRRALVAGVLVALSGSVLWVSGPLTSDGLSEALSILTIAAALAYRRRPTVSGAVAIAIAGASALSVKSLLAGIVVPVIWAMATAAGGARRAHLALAAAVATVVALACALPFGLGRVWDQAFRYHLDVAGNRAPLANIGKVATTLVDRDLPLVALALAALAAALVARRRVTTPRPDSVASDLTPIWLWLAATIAMLVLEHPLWRNHVAHIVAPLALLVALRPPPARAFAAIVAVTLPWYVVHDAGVLWPAPYRASTRQAVADVRSLPAGTWSISDEPGLVWRAGKRPPADLVDTSKLRIEEGRITTRSLVNAADDRRVCTVLVWSRRFADLPGFPDALARIGFVEARRYGGRRILYVKNACQLP